MTVTVTGLVVYTGLPGAPGTDGYPDGAWSCTLRPIGDATAGQVVMTVESRKNLLASRALTIEGLGVRQDSNLGNEVYWLLQQWLASDGATSSWVEGTATLRAFTNVTVEELPKNVRGALLPHWVSMGAPIGDAFTASLTVLQAQLLTNRNLEQYYLNSWGWWWDSQRLRGLGKRAIRP